MRHTRSEPTHGFHLLTKTERGQAAIMVLDVGESTGGPNNRHARSDQWLYVLSGAGEATVEGETVSLQAGSLLLIEAAEAHEIRTVGNQSLETLNIYTPPEY